ncbi:MAG: hypothetical protein ACYC3F_05600 [Gemmatimonadaceae bacterium]
MHGKALLLNLSTASFIGEGAFADVSRDQEGAAVKLFRRADSTPDLLGTPEDRDIIVRAVWDAEVSAYERAALHPGLGRYLAPYFGRRNVAEVRGADGRDISNQYILDCAYSVAFVPGVDRKMGELMDHPLFRDIDSYLDELRESGICSPYDGSVFIPGLETPFTIIDVGTWEAAAELAYVITEKGSLPDHIRARYGAL